MSPIPYNNLTSRTDAAALIPEEVSRAMLDRATAESAAMRLFRRIPVSRNQVRFPVVSALPVAYFVNGDTGLKQTTEVNWANKFLNIEEIAVLWPVPDNVADDVELNIWDSAMPFLVEAFYRTLDAAVFFGTNAPVNWPTNVSAAATAAGNSFTEASTAAQGGFFGDFDKTVALLDADGFDFTGVVADTSTRALIRASRDTTGQRLDPARTTGRVSGNLGEIDGVPLVYPMRGLWPTGSGAPRLFVGDWTQFVLGVRSDITAKVFDSGVINDQSGGILFNLMQQDMRALRLTFRIGWQVSNLINFDQPTEGSRFPAAKLVRA